MKFWCATAFMNTTELVHVAKLLDRAGYHGLMVSDHLVLPAGADRASTRTRPIPTAGRSGSPRRRGPTRGC